MSGYFIQLNSKKEITFVYQNMVGLFWSLACICYEKKFLNQLKFSENLEKMQNTSKLKFSSVKSQDIRWSLKNHIKISGTAKFAVIVSWFEFFLIKRKCIFKNIHKDFKKMQNIQVIREQEKNWRRKKGEWRICLMGTISKKQS